MAVFSYKALNAKGKTIKGVIDAENPRAARQKLKSQGVFPTQLEESRTLELRKKGFSKNVLPAKGRKVSTSLLAIVTRQLATLVAAGMPLVESLKALGSQIDHVSLREVMADVCDKVNEGSTLAASMREFPGIFPKLYVNMVESGEASGSLDMVLERLADLLESQAILQRKVMSAMAYPILMLVLCFGVIMLLLAYVVPQVTKIFENQGAILPLPTRVVIGLSAFVQDFWPLMLIIIAAVVFGLRAYTRTKKGRKATDTFLLRLPLLGAMRLKVATSRFSRNLGMLLTSGVQLLVALSIVRNIIGNVVLEEAIDQAIEGVKEGRGLAQELGNSEVFPRLLVHMIAIGEKTGQLEQMLIRAAAAYESEVDAVISSFTSILEPILIIFLALVVGGILAAVMLPMLEMTSMVK